MGLNALLRSVRRKYSRKCAIRFFSLETYASIVKTVKNPVSIVFYKQNARDVSKHIKRNARLSRIPLHHRYLEVR